MKGKLPIVTVKILTYNNFDYLEQTIESVFSQDYPNIELMLSDDGSLNYDIGYIEKLISKKTDNIKNVRIIHHEENIGIVRNFNNCIKNASGDYFIGLASDDMFYDEFVISNVVDYFKKTKALIITSRKSVYDNEMQKEIEILPKKSDIEYLLDNKKLLFERLCFSNFISGAGTFYSKELFDKYGMFDEKYNLIEDYPYYLKLVRKGEPVFFYDEITIKYRLGGVSTSGKANIKLSNDRIRIIRNEIFPFINKKINNSLYNWKAFEYYYEINNRKINLHLMLKYPKEIFLKVLNRMDIIKIRPKKIIKTGKE